MGMATEDVKDEGQGILAWHDSVDDELSVTVWMCGGAIWLSKI